MSRIKEALEIIKNTDEYHPIHAREFAQKFWPDSIMHLRVHNTGNGACHGKGAWLCAGSYMGKLIKQGFVRRDYNFTGYHITNKGTEKLKEL